MRKHLKKKQRDMYKESLLTEVELEMLGLYSKYKLISI